MAADQDGKCEHCGTHIGPVGYHASSACIDVLKRQRDQTEGWLRAVRSELERQMKNTQAWYARYLAAKAEGERMAFQLQNRLKEILGRK